MQTDDLRRLTGWSLAAGLAGALVALVLGSPTWAAGVLAGSLWGVANLHVLRVLIVGHLRPAAERARDPRVEALLVGLVVKFPVLYGVGFLLLRSSWFSVEGLMIGFVLPFTMAFLGAVARSSGARPGRPARGGEVGVAEGDRW